MTFSEFITKWTGKPVDFDGIYPNQCMDLMHQYVYEVLGITDKQVLAAPAAYQAYTNNYPQYFTKIDNTPTGVPQEGDILFFGQQVGQWGHVCIFVSGDANKFKSFDANWPVGTLPHIQDHNYTGVLGWLRPLPVQSQQAIIDELRLARDTNYNDKVAEIAKNTELTKQNQDLQQQLQNLRTAFDLQTKADADTGSQLLEAQHETNALKSSLNNIATALTTNSDEKSILEAITHLRSASDDIAKQYAVLQKAFESSAIYKRIPKKTLSIWDKIKGLFIKEV